MGYIFFSVTTDIPKGLEMAEIVDEYTPLDNISYSKKNTKSHSQAHMHPCTHTHIHAHTHTLTCAHMPRIHAHTYAHTHMPRRCTHTHSHTPSTYFKINVAFMKIINALSYYILTQYTLISIILCTKLKFCFGPTENTT